jgi:hypothetical protein
MRRLFRSALALFALGLTVIGCNRSNPPGPGDDAADRALAEAPYKAAFRVPGMT